MRMVRDEVSMGKTCTFAFSTWQSGSVLSVSYESRMCIEVLNGFEFRSVSNCVYL